MENKYSRIVQRHNDLMAVSTVNDTELLMEMDCIIHFFECEGYKKYEFVLGFANEKGFKRVFDIGCAYGHQSEVFLNSDVEYIGINDMGIRYYWNLDKYIYISESYPFQINAKKTDLAVSILCLTWNCYLFEGEKTLREQCGALSRDFKHALLYMPKDKIEFVSKYFSNYEMLDDNFVYFYNLNKELRVEVEE